MKKFLLVLFTFAIILVSCKKESSSEKSEKEPSQIIGVRYATMYIDIYSSPGSTKKEERVTNIYALEEVTGLELVDEKGKKYLKVKTVTGKEGFALADRFVEAIYITVADGVTAFKKPTLTAPTEGKMNKAAICYMKEMQGEWGNVNCDSAKYEYGSKPVSYHNVWVQLSDTSLSKDPMLAQTAMSIRTATRSIAELSTAKDVEKAKAEIKKNLGVAIEKQDVFSAYAKEILDKLESNGDSSVPPLDTPEVPKENEPLKQEEDQSKPAG
jgi:lipoprotein LenA